MNAATSTTSTNKPTTKDYVYRVSAAVANAILVTLGIGLLFQTIAQFIHWQPLYDAGTMGTVLLAPALGVAVASQLDVNTLVIFSAMISATVGSNAVHFTTKAVNGTSAVGGPSFSTGQPVSAVAAALIAALVGKYLTGKTPLDMVLVPFGATTAGTISGLGLAAVTTPLLLDISRFIEQSMHVNPVLGSVCVSLAWALFLMSPASSAALSIALTLDPISSAAALIGTTSQFVAFTAMSCRQNNLGANIAQSLVTPKIQFPNIVLNPYLLIPSLVSAVVSAPVATVLFHFRSNYTLGGLGLNSLIAPLAYAAKGVGPFAVYMFTGVVLPAAISVFVYLFMKRANLIGENQLKLQVI